MASESDGSRRETEPLDRLMGTLWNGVRLGFGALFLSMIAAASFPRGTLAALGIGVLIFLLAFSIGSLLGFLFGVPRAIASDAPVDLSAPVANAGTNPAAAGGVAPPAAPAGEVRPTRQRVRKLQSNTNLERVSDWLTTLLLGAGLAELHSVNGYLVEFRDFIADCALVFTVDGKPSAGPLPAIAPVVLIFGAVCGFLFMYLSTRLVLVRVFDAIEGHLDRDEYLPSDQTRAVKAIAANAAGGEGFVANALGQGRKMTVQQALGVMFDLLYRSDPDKVIELAASLAGGEAEARADYWFYLAAAFGQKLHRLDRDTPDWLSARDNALDCARRAVALAGAYRARLWSISDPTAYDNDLAPLRDDPEFLRIVGRGADGFTAS